MVSIIIKEWTTKIELVPTVQKRNAAVLLRKPGRLAPQYAFYYTRFLNSTFSVYFRLKFHVDFRKSVYTFFHYGYPCL